MIKTGQQGGKKMKQHKSKKITITKMPNKQILVKGNARTKKRKGGGGGDGLDGASKKSRSLRLKNWSVREANKECVWSELEETNAGTDQPMGRLWGGGQAERGGEMLFRRLIPRGGTGWQKVRE